MQTLAAAVSNAFGVPVESASFVSLADIQSANADGSVFSASGSFIVYFSTSARASTFGIAWRASGASNAQSALTSALLDPASTSQSAASTGAGGPQQGPSGVVGGASAAGAIVIVAVVLALVALRRSRTTRSVKYATALSSAGSSSAESMEPDVSVVPSTVDAVEAVFNAPVSPHRPMSGRAPSRRAFAQETRAGIDFSAPEVLSARLEEDL